MLPREVDRGDHICDVGAPHEGLAVALGYTATTHQLVADRAGAAEAASELISLCDRYAFSFYGQWGVVVDGWVRGGEAGVVRIQEGINNFGRRARTLGCRTGCTCWPK